MKHRINTQEVTGSNPVSPTTEQEVMPEEFES
jgi:hypothetical protein